MKLFINLLIYFFISNQVLSQVVDIKFSKTENIFGGLINIIDVNSIALCKNGDIVVNWTKNQSDSTINNKSLFIRSDNENNWFQAELFDNDNNLCLGAISCSNGDTLSIVRAERSFNKFHGKSNKVSCLSFSQYKNNSWSRNEVVVNYDSSKNQRYINNYLYFVDKLSIAVIAYVVSTESTKNVLMLSKRYEDGWRSMTIPANNPTNFGFDIDKHNKYHLVTTEYDYISKGAHNTIFYQILNNKDDTSSLPIKILRNQKISIDDLLITVDNEDTKHVIFSANTRKKGFPNAIYYVRCKKNGEWSDTIIVSKNLEGNSVNPNVVVDSNNNLHLFWEWSPSLFKKSSYILYSKYCNGTWSDPTIVFENGSAPIVKIDQHDNIHLIYKDLSQKDKKNYPLVYSKTKNPVTTIK